MKEPNSDLFYRSACIDWSAVPKDIADKTRPHIAAAGAALPFIVGFSDEVPDGFQAEGREVVDTIDNYLKSLGAETGDLIVIVL